MRRLSLLIELADVPGALERALHPFTAHGVNLTHIESRPARDGRFDFYVDCEGRRGEPAMEAVIAALDADAHKLLVLDERAVPWFPRHVSELDGIAGRIREAGADLQADHPGFHDPEYRARRAAIAAIALSHRSGQLFPIVRYTSTEVQSWGLIFDRLREAHARHACAEYLRTFAEMARECGYAPDHIPQGRDVSAFLSRRTGFELRPVAGLLESRDFLNALAFRVFFCTQYVRHPTTPLYTPEPDVCHELIGHAPMLADPAFADLSQEIGLASLGASDADIDRLARCYWHSVEFGLVRERTHVDEPVKAYGAGLLSSFGELEHACTSETVERRGWDPASAAAQAFPITEYQPIYYVAESLHDAADRMRAYCETLSRPFYARLNPATRAIWVDRAVRRNSPECSRTTRSLP